MHSPFVFELAQTALEDTRWFYAFSDVERLRQAMLASPAPLLQTDYGAGAGEATVRQHDTTVRAVARRAASSARQGQLLFRLVAWRRPAVVLELGTSLGIGTAYLSAAALDAQVVSLEGCPRSTALAREHLAMLGRQNVTLHEGPFENTLLPVLQNLPSPDVVFLDGNHRPAPTLAYFEMLLRYSNDRTMFIFDDVHGSPGMEEAWAKIKAHPRVTLTVDFFDLSLVFIQPEFREKQHFCIVPFGWKPWMLT